MLVVDIRNSSAFFQNSPAVEVARFVTQLSELAFVVTQTVSDGFAEDVHIDKFTGDGFLILFDEPSPDALAKIGPARALVAARMFRRRFRRLLVEWEDRVSARSEFRDLGLVSGIVYGNVLYGPLTRPATLAPTVLLEPVVKAFRYAQVRGEAGLRDDDCILICRETRLEVLGLRSSQDLDDHRRLRDSVLTADYLDIRPSGLKGVLDPTTYEVVWSAD